MALLILDGAGPGVRASVPGHGMRSATRAGELAAATVSLLEEAGLAPARLEAIVGLVGPGSFTGLRAALALAHGLALGCRVTLVAVASAEAFRAALPGRPLLAAFAGGRAGRFVLQQISAAGDIAPPSALDAAQMATVPLAPSVTLVGPAGAQAAGLLRNTGREVAGPILPRPEDAEIEAVARARLSGRIPLRPVMPFYADDLFESPP